MEKERIIIGLTGSFGSGVSEVATILEEKLKFKKYHISTILKKEAENKGIDLGEKKKEERKILQDIGNDIRKREGLGVLIKRAIKEMEQEEVTTPIVIDSIKNPGEVEELKKFSNAYLIAIDASFHIRWERVKDKYDKDQTAFERDDERDKNEGIKHGQRVQECVNLSDILINNEKNIKSSVATRKEFETEIARYVEMNKTPGCRHPTYMELLMNNAYCTSLLSHCLKRQVGAIIVVSKDMEGFLKNEAEKEKTERYYVIASGYNDVPVGEEDCVVKFEECYRDKVMSEFFEKFKFCPNCGTKIELVNSTNHGCPNSSCKLKERGFTIIEEDYSYSKALDLCRALHAEESAILQASYLGGGIPLEGAILYTTTFPCQLCAKKIIACGIREVVYIEAYPSKNAIELLNGARIKLTKFKGVKAEAFYKLFKDYKK